MKIDFPLEIKICDSKKDRNSFNNYIREIMTDYVIVITGESYSYGITLNLIKSIELTPIKILKIKDNTIPNIQDNFGLADSSKIKILAIGGGKVCDVAKRISFCMDCELIIYPTIVANDGLLSPIAVISDGVKSSSLPGKMPDQVFIDLLLIKAAPSKYLISAALDLLSNLSATADWQYATEKGEKGLNHLAFQLSRMAANQLLDCASWELNSDEFLRAVINGQILSAISMAYAGSSRPCSGSEHLISHALDQLQFNNDILHGQQVGRTSMFTTYLQGSFNKKILRLCESLGVRKTFIDDQMSDQDLLRIFETCRTVRPGRKTILDKYSNEQLLTKYHEFQLGSY